MVQLAKAAACKCFHSFQILSHFYKWRRFERQEKRLFLEAAVFSIGMRLMLSVIPFRHIAPWLGEQNVRERVVEVSAESHTQRQQIQQAVYRTSQLFRWRNACLVNAIVAKWMLRRRAIQSELFLGLANDQNRQLIAHAWLRCGNVLITGGPHQHYVVMTSFS